MMFTIPELSLVVLIGPSGCGKSTFARKHFKPTEVMSSDAFRALVSDDEPSVSRQWAWSLYAVPEAFTSKDSQRAMQLALLIADDVRTEVTIRP